MDNNKALWVFGYGSLIWRVDFPYAERRPAYIKDYARRFWQGSTDHRGTPEAPGRVVTLIEQAGALCWGMAYRITQEQSAQVLAHLDYREKGGYERSELPLYLQDQGPVTGLTYHATADNPNFLGATDSLSIARQVVASNGPSGRNIEYVLCLQEALKELGVADSHVWEIAEHVRRISACLGVEVKKFIR